MNTYKMSIEEALKIMNIMFDLIGEYHAVDEEGFIKMNEAEDTICEFVKAHS